MDKICLKCGKKFRKPCSCSKKEWAERKFCSHSCANSVSASRDRLKNYIKKNGIWNKGKIMPRGKSNPAFKRVEKKCLECGEIFIVKKYREKTAKFCSKKCSWKNRDKGKTTLQQRLRSSKEFKIWRELVYERDDWTCQKCMLRGQNLNPHHIENFSTNEEKRTDIDNGITLCRKCHYEFHSKYGFNNNNRSQIKEFLAQEA